MPAANVVDWLLTPLSGASEHVIAMHLAWHGRLMVLSWGVLLPIGVLVARYFKVRADQDWPRVLDNKWWWDRHRQSQYAGVLLMTIGVALAWCFESDSVTNSGAGIGAGRERSGAWTIADLHRTGGWIIFALGWLQVVGAWFRGTKGGPTDPRATPDDPSTWRGDHYDMSMRRQLFEWQHKLGGWIALALAAATLASGLVHADAPRWMFGSLALWWVALAALAAHWQRRGRCVDTWEAIWGPPPQDGQPPPA